MSESNTHYEIEWRMAPHGDAWDSTNVKYRENQIQDVIHHKRLRFPNEEFRAVKITTTHEVMDL